ncbi:hypothetical protein [Exiguobacterium mexicanum]|uniref:hypothetical protein n=1 Tax=Exiguobacterium mexicanum TaxID=340146 RepID=UPI0037C06A19
MAATAVAPMPRATKIVSMILYSAVTSIPIIAGSDSLNSRRPIGSVQSCSVF